MTAPTSYCNECGASNPLLRLQHCFATSCPIASSPGAYCQRCHAGERSQRWPSRLLLSAPLALYHRQADRYRSPGLKGLRCSRAVWQSADHPPNLISTAWATRCTSYSQAMIPHSPSFTLPHSLQGVHPSLLHSTPCSSRSWRWR
jgi:hypothetical protein